MKAFSILILLLITLIVFSCEKEKEGFALNIKVNGDYRGYLYLSYENTRDSVLVNEFGNNQFRGKVTKITRGDFYAPNVSATSREFYLENKEIRSEITISKRKGKSYEYNWIEIDTLVGTEISKTRNDFMQFKKTHQRDNDYALKLFKKIDEIIKDNSTNEFSGNFLDDIAREDTLLSLEQKQLLFKNLDIKHQGEYTIKRIASKIFPKKINVGKNIIDFELPDLNEEKISTKDFRNDVVFIDFWASWCAPCIKEFPNLEKIKTKYEAKNFQMLGVSLDENKEAWTNAMKKHNPSWNNVIDTKSLVGQIAKDYDVFSLPSNVLVDEKGVVLGKDVSIDELEVKLDSIYN